MIVASMADLVAGRNRTTFTQHPEQAMRIDPVGLAVVTKTDARIRLAVSIPPCLCPVFNTAVRTVPEPPCQLRHQPLPPLLRGADERQ